MRVTASGGYIHLPCTVMPLRVIGGYGKWNPSPLPTGSRSIVLHDDDDATIGCAGI